MRFTCIALLAACLLSSAKTVDGTSILDYFLSSKSNNVDGSSNGNNKKSSIPDRTPENDREMQVSPITDFVLVNAQTGKDIMIMLDGMVIDTSEYGTELTIRVETTFTTGFVKIDFDHGKLRRVEGLVPYYLAGDEDGVIYTSNSLAQPGKHTLTACPSETAFFEANEAHHETGRRRSLLDDPTCLTITFETIEDLNSPIQTEPPIIIDSTDVKPADAGIFGFVTGDLMTNHKLTLAFSGPPASETGMTIPGTYRPPSVFPDYRLDVTFTHSDGITTYTVPGYYAGDGDTANNQGGGGNVWQVHFTPNLVGTWTWVAKFVEGTNVAQNGGGNPGGFFDGATGSFDISPSTVSDPNDLRKKGRLSSEMGSNFFKFANGEYFIKVGPDSPQNLLAYSDFDGTPNFGNYSKSFELHKADYNGGEPTFAGGKGIGFIGAINYLASKGMNILSVTTLNTEGDDKNIYPFVTLENQLQYDISKLSQWAVIFDYTETKNMALRIKLQDSASDNVLNMGDLFEERKLYYREMIARFGHHLAIIWDLGEDLSVARITERIAYIREVDPYDSPIIVRTTSSATPITDLLAIPEVDGVSLVTPDVTAINGNIASWLQASTNGIAVSCDEQGSSALGVSPDFADATHDIVRKNVLWGSLMSGGTGVQYYFGTSLAESDLTLEDFRSRDILWTQTKYALDFFKKNSIPIQNMKSNNGLVSSGNLCLAATDASVIVVYTSSGLISPTVTVSGKYSISWYNPRTGGNLIPSTIKTISTTGKIGRPAVSVKVGDFVALLKKI